MRISGGTIIKKIVISLLLFIFCAAIQAWADTVKTLNRTVYQGSIIKMDENEAIKTQQKNNDSFQSDNFSKNDEIAIGNSESKVNLLLESQEGKERSKLIDSIDKVISRYKIDQNVWRNEFLECQPKSQNSEFGQSTLKPYPDGNEDFEKGGLTTFKLLNSKRTEIFTEIFMLFHFLFNPKGEHMFLEISSIPFSEKGRGLFIPFKKLKSVEE